MATRLEIAEYEDPLSPSLNYPKSGDFIVDDIEIRVEKSHQLSQNIFYIKENLNKK